jgi:hypothetical protein
LPAVRQKLHLALCADFRDRLLLLVSILGLIYVAVSGIGMGQGYGLSIMTLAIDAEFRRIRALLNSPPEPDEKDALRQIEVKQVHDMAFMFINSIGLMIVSVLCLYFLLTASSYPS